MRHERVMMQNSFAFTGMPRLCFGAGCIEALGRHARGFGRAALLVTGGESLTRSGHFAQVTTDLRSFGLRVHHCQVTGEPSPSVVDAAVARFSPAHPDVVIAIGGGSVLDAGKAIAAMLREGGPVADYLEGVGPRRPSGHTLPLIAVPTTAGTGSEATKNAVLSRVGGDGFKKSLRHDNYIPALAIVDPALATSAPPSVTAACGMDALSQLIESFVSAKASALTDALAADGMKRLIPALPDACGRMANDPACRADVAYGAFLSGVTLAHAGLGVVHGVAGPLGGLVPIPHGIACANLLPAAMATTLVNLRQTEDSPAARIAEDKFARIGRWFGRRYTDPHDCCEHLVATLYDWLDRFAIPRLGHFGLTAEHVDRLVEMAGNKNNPVPLNAEQIRRMVQDRC